VIGKLILMSLLLATFVIPMRAAAAEPSAARGFRKVVVGLIVFDLCYLLAIIYIYPHFA